ncbi:MAG TPA: hypothetical protein PKN48_08235 [Bacteroidales bacterium]|nr:hypothetical protein [Bacteroidales bacterium]
MKRLVFLFFIINIFTYKTVTCQKSESEMHVGLFMDDSVMNIITNKIPQGWEIKNENNKLIFLKKDSIWVHKDDRSSLKNLTKEQIQQKIKEKGIKTTCFIIFSYESKWTFDDMLVATYNNALYNEEINKLSEKYKISQYEDKEHSTRFNKVYKATKAGDQKILDAYNEEKNSLLSKMKKIPDYHTTKFSLYLLEMHGYNDNNTLVFPDEASINIFTIKNLFDEICMHPKFK